MARTFIELSQLTNRALLLRVDELVRRERRVQAALIAYLSELDARRLYIDEGCSSFFDYCVEKLGYSESAAFRRMEAARAARRFPVILERLGDGTLNLTTVAILAKHLTPANHRQLLDAAAGKSRVEVEALVARARGGATVLRRSTVRVVPVAAPVSAPRGGGAAEPPAGGAMESPTERVDMTNSTSAGGSSMPVIAETTGSTPATTLAYRHSVTLTAEEHADLARARELLRTLVPGGDPARVIGRALRMLVASLEARKFGAVKSPREVRHTPGASHAATPAHSSVSDTSDPPSPTRAAPTRPTRTIPAAVRRAVTGRDAGRCTFVSASGRRCTERGALEFHHRRPIAKAGPTTADNLTLLCPAHHRRETERVFGPPRKYSADRTTSASGSAAAGPAG